MNRASASIASMICCIAIASAALAAEFPVSVEEKVLANGLKVLVMPKKGSPSTACALVFRAGSVNELPGQAGIAHFLEHMMFKGTLKIGVKDAAADAEIERKLDETIREIIVIEDSPGSEESRQRLAELRAKRDSLFEEQKKNIVLNHIFKLYHDAGGTFTNASTSEDWTGYYCVLPPEKIELFFWIEAERWKNAVFRQFHAEKDVVREERRLMENRPGSAFREETEKALYGSHPYSHPVIGYHEDLRRLTSEDLYAFFREHYTPDNAFLVIGGDVEPGRAFALASRYFGGIPASDKRRRRVPSQLITGAGEIRLSGSGRGKPSVRIYFRVPAVGSAEELPMEFIARRLSGREEPLFKELVENRKAAVSLDADCEMHRHAGMFEIRVELAEPANPAAAEEAVWAAVDELKSSLLQAGDMDRLSRKYRSDVLGTVRSDMRLGFMLLHREAVGSWRDIEGLLQRAKVMDAAEIKAAAGKYFTRENSVTAVYLQGGKDSVAPKPAPVEAAAPAPVPQTDVPDSWTGLRFESRPFSVPSGAEARKVLSNGIRAFAVTDPGSPTLRVVAFVQGGKFEDPAQKAGLSDLAARLWSEAGTPDLGRAAVKDKLDGMAAEFSVESGDDWHKVAIDLFPSDADEGLAMFRKLLSEPRFDPEVFERARSAMKAGLEDEEINPHMASSKFYSDLLWGGVKANIRPTPEGLDSMTIDEVRAEILARTGPERIILAVSGPFEQRALIEMAEKALGAIKPGGARKYSRSAEKNDPLAAAAGVHVKAMPLNQGYVRVGILTVRKGHEDEAGLRVLSAILGKRIFNIIRSVHGLSYGAHAHLDQSWQYDSPLTISFQTKCSSVPFGVRLAVDEAMAIAKDGPTEEEMIEGRMGADTSLRMSLASGNDAADSFAELEARGAGLEYYREFETAARKLSRESLAGLAAKYFVPGKFLICCVGDAGPIQDGDPARKERLSDFGKVTVVEGKKADPHKSPRALAAAMMSAIAQNDLEALKGLTCGKMRAFLDDARSAAQLRGQLQMLKTAKFSLDAVEEKDGAAEARIAAEIDTGGGKMKIVMKLRLVLAEGKWKCEGMQTGG